MQNFKLFFENSSMSMFAGASGYIVTQTDKGIKKQHVSDIAAYIEKVKQDLNDEYFANTAFVSKVTKSTGRGYTITIKYQRFDPATVPAFLRSSVTFGRLRLKVIPDRKEDGELTFKPTTLKFGKHILIDKKPTYITTWGDPQINSILRKVVPTHIKFFISQGYIPSTTYVAELYEYIAPSIFVKLTKNGEEFFYARRPSPGADMAYTVFYTKNKATNVYHLTFKEEYNNNLDVIRTPTSIKYVIKGTDKIHKDDGPASITYHFTGTPESIVYAQNGQPHRVGGPAIQKFSRSGKLQRTKYMHHGLYHNDQGPADVLYDEGGKPKNISYYKHNKLHRMDGPASITIDRNGTIHERYFINGNEYSKEKFHSIVSDIEKDQMEDLGDMLTGFD